MENNNIIECAGFYFMHNFDSGNLGHVEQVPKELIIPCINQRTNALETPHYEFNMWTRPDCAGTEFENGNRTWFYFGIQGGEPGVLVRLNLVNLNKQGKMYNQGMAPVTRTLPGKPHWERIRDKPVHSTDENTFVLSFKYKTPENPKATIFFAFTYPFSYAELQIALNTIDLKFLPLTTQPNLDDIYYWRECVVHSLESRRVDLLTISSYHGITDEREDRLKNLFPEKTERAVKFKNKKVIFLSARVHPGETPSSFVFNGFLNLLLNRNDAIAIILRKLYVFKLVPFLNPDGVARGHYRTDTRGVNLNRVYLCPSLDLHPSVYAARALIRYYHYGCEKDEDPSNEEELLCSIMNSQSNQSANTIDETQSDTKRKRLTSGCKQSGNAKKDGRMSPVTDRKHNIRKDGRKSLGSEMQTGEASGLVDQVLELKLHEAKTQTEYKYVDKECSTSTSTSAQLTSMFDEVVVRDCLGSEVHLSRSDELNIQGPNPLKQLRDTLKNSISLLMGSHFPTGQSESTSKSGESSIQSRVGWCEACKKAANELESRVPGITGILPSVKTEKNLIDEDETSKNSIGNLVCTNCFKPILLVTEMENDAVKDTNSNLGSVESAGDNRKQDSSDDVPVADNNGDKYIGAKAKTTPKMKKKVFKPMLNLTKNVQKESESGIYLYIDLHGHASKKGIFMYGNHFEDVESSVECMLLPRVMSLNNLHFHFSSCNFTERNMYLRDRRDGMSREGSGRVAVLKATGLVRSYTLECNYNTGRLVNILPPTLRETGGAASTTASPASATLLTPPKYAPALFEEVGRSLGASILDLTGHHPNSRIPGSEHRNLTTIREWLRAHTRHLRPPQITMTRLRPKLSPTRTPLYSRSSPKSKLSDADRKENTYLGAKCENDATRKGTTIQASCSNELVNVRYPSPKRNQNMKVLTCRSRYYGDSPNTPKGNRPLSSSKTQRNVLISIKKPNIGKNQGSKAISSVIKNRMNFSNKRTPSVVSRGVSPVPVLVSKTHGYAPRITRTFRKEGSLSRTEIKKGKSSSKEGIFQKAQCSKTLGKRSKPGQFGKVDMRMDMNRNRRSHGNPAERLNASSSTSSGEENVHNWDTMRIPTVLDEISQSNSDGSLLTARLQPRSSGGLVSSKRGRPSFHKLAPSKTDLRKIRLKTTT